MERITLSVCDFYNNKRLLTVYSIAPGLGVSRHPKFFNSWTLTHIPSGHRLYGDYDTKRDAIRAATSVAPLVDWTQSFERLCEYFGKKENADKFHRIHNNN